MRGGHKAVPSTWHHRIAIEECTVQRRETGWVVWVFRFILACLIVFAVWALGLAAWRLAF